MNKLGPITVWEGDQKIGSLPAVCSEMLGNIALRHEIPLAKALTQAILNEQIVEDILASGQELLVGTPPSRFGRLLGQDTKYRYLELD